MNKPLDPAYVEALRRKPWLPPEIYVYPAATRIGVERVLPPMPEPKQEAARFDWRDAACLLAVVVLWAVAAL